MSANACPRCGKTLAVRDQARATCPFCSAPLERSATRPLDAAPAADEGYASFQVSPAVKVNGTPPPSPKLAAPGLTPAAGSLKPAASGLKPTSSSLKPAAPGLTPGLTATAKSLRSTMVGSALAPGGLSFGGAPALSPPLPAAPARTAAPAPAAATAAALDPVSRTPAPVVRTPVPSVQRSASPPAAAPPPAPPARGSATVRPLVSESESEPTHVMPPSAAGSATDTNLLADSDLEEPTHVREPGSVTPSLTFPDSDPIASVTLEPDAEPPVLSGPVLSGPMLLRAQPRRGLALVGLAMGLAIVGVAVAGVKLLGGTKTTPTSVSTRAAAAPAKTPPVIAAIEPKPAPSVPAARAVPPPARAKAVTATPPPAKAKAVPATPPPPKAKAVPATIAHSAAAPRAAAPAEDHRATGRQGGKRNQRHAARARKVAMKAPAAKRNATTTTTTPERGDPRPHYERGNALLFAGDSKGAIAAYREAIRVDPSDPSAFRGLGLAYEQQSEPVFAARALRRYLKLAPNAADRVIVNRRLERLAHQPKRK